MTIDKNIKKLSKIQKTISYDEKINAFFIELFLNKIKSIILNAFKLFNIIQLVLFVCWQHANQNQKNTFKMEKSILNTRNSLTREKYFFVNIFYIFKTMKKMNLCPVNILSFFKDLFFRFCLIFF